jgi:hypothetical protein
MNKNMKQKWIAYILPFERAQASLQCRDDVRSFHLIVHINNKQNIPSLTMRLELSNGKAIS